MRLVVALGALTAVMIGAAHPARASEQGPWCALFWGGDDQYENCSMRSFEMCLAEIRGTGGNTLCSPNPRYHALRSDPGPMRQPRWPRLSRKRLLSPTGQAIATRLMISQRFSRTG